MSKRQDRQLICDIKESIRSIEAYTKSMSYGNSSALGSKVSLRGATATKQSRFEIASPFGLAMTLRR